MAPPSGWGPTCAEWAGDDPARLRQVEELWNELGPGGDDGSDVPYLLLEQAWAAVRQAADRRGMRAVLVACGDDAVAHMARLAERFGILQPVRPDAWVRAPEIDGVSLWLLARPVLPSTG